MVARYVQAGTASTITTVAILWIMQALVALTNGYEPVERPRVPIDWIRISPPEDPPHSILDDPPAPPLPVPPETPRRTELEIEPVDIKFPGQLAPLPPAAPKPASLQFADGPLVSLTYVRPVYPGGLLARGVEGHVLVEFDVTAKGTVSNVRIIESSHVGFERAAVRAAEKFRFKPHVLNGEPVASHGIRNLFRFEIDE